MPASPPIESDLAALRDALLSAHLQQLRTLESFDELSARRAQREMLEAERARAVSEIAPLERWDEIPQRTFEVQSRQQPRMRRVLDHVVPGDRVLDIGPGYGYLTGILLRDAWLGHYVGIDISEAALRSIRALVVRNGLGDRSLHLERRSLLEVDAAFLRVHRPDLILALEVLAHLEDPEAALAGLAAAMSDEHALLLSVPVLGRLEQVWGHRSVFDSGRLLAMCAGAGLHVQSIEAVHNVWAFVLATRSANPPERLLRLARRGRLASPDVGVPRTTFTSVPLDAALTKPLKRTGRKGVSVVARAGRNGVSCRTTGEGRTRGLVLPIPAPARLRLELSFPEAASIRAVDLEGLDAEGGRTMRWTWRAGTRPPLPQAATAFPLVPGLPHGGFTPVGTTDPARTTAIRIGLTADGDRPATVVLHRADVLPHDALR